MASFTVKDRTKNYKEIYTQLQQLSYNDLIDYIQRIVAVDPQLSQNFQGKINSYTQQQLLVMVAEIISNLQNLQVNEKKFELMRKHKETVRQNNWTFFKKSILAYQNSFAAVAVALGSSTAEGEKIGVAIQQAIAVFELEKYIFFNPNSKQLESTEEPNQSGKGGRRITLEILWQLISKYSSKIKSFIQNASDKNTLFKQQIVNRPEFQILRYTILSLSHAQRGIKVNINKFFQISTGKPALKKIKTQIATKLKRYLNDSVYSSKINAYTGNNPEQGLNSKYSEALNALKLEPQYNTKIKLFSEIPKGGLKTQQKDIIEILQQRLPYVPKELQEQFDIDNKGKLELKDYAKKLQLKNRIKNIV